MCIRGLASVGRLHFFIHLVLTLKEMHLEKKREAVPDVWRITKIRQFSTIDPKQH